MSSFLKKKVPSLVLTRQVKRWSAVELGASLSRTIAWGRGEQHQQFSTSVSNPHPAENTETFFSPLGALLSLSLLPLYILLVINTLIKLKLGYLDSTQNLTFSTDQKSQGILCPASAT